MYAKISNNINKLDNMEGQFDEAPNDTSYTRWSCHSSHKLLCKLCRTLPLPAILFLIFFRQVGHADLLDGWRCSSQKRMMSRLIQIRQLQTNESGFVISAINQYMLGSRYISIRCNRIEHWVHLICAGIH